jgi:hypothetical protein
MLLVAVAVNNTGDWLVHVFYLSHLERRRSTIDRLIVCIFEKAYKLF